MVVVVAVVAIDQKQISFTSRSHGFEKIPSRSTIFAIGRRFCKAVKAPAYKVMWT